MPRAGPCLCHPTPGKIPVTLTEDSACSLVCGFPVAVSSSGQIQPQRMEAEERVSEKRRKLHFEGLRREEKGLEMQQQGESSWNGTSSSAGSMFKAGVQCETWEELNPETAVWSPVPGHTDTVWSWDRSSSLHLPWDPWPISLHVRPSSSPVLTVPVSSAPLPQSCMA